MRIIGGKFGGRKLSEFKDIGVRPSSDMVRESLFNIIGSDIEGARFLDLFSGSGAVGIEAISRGASEVVFTDNSKDSIDLEKKNLSSLGISTGFKVYKTDAISFLESTTEKFDYIYIDPPYKSDLKEKAVILSEKLLNPLGIIILEDENPVTFKPKGLSLYSTRRYGRANLYFFRRKKAPCVFAGTFDPLSLGHVDVIDRCIDGHEKVVLTLGENSGKTPYFSRQTRLNMLKAVYGKNENVKIVDYTAEKDYKGLLESEGVKYYIRGIRNDTDRYYEESKRAVNDKIYPNLETVFIKADKKLKDLSSTLIREKLKNGKTVDKLVPKEIIPLIEANRKN